MPWCQHTSLLPHHFQEEKSVIWLYYEALRISALALHDAVAWEQVGRSVLGSLP